MKRSMVVLIVAVALLMGTIGLASEAQAVRVYISPPVLTFSVAPELAVIPGTYVYWVPGVEAEMYFYQGWWYRPYEGRWYRGRGYNGPWKYYGNVPRVLMNLPPGYRDWTYGPNHRMPYTDVHKNWRSWERNRYWHNDERWREHRGHERNEGPRRDHGGDGRDRGHGNPEWERGPGGHGPEGHR